MQPGKSTASIFAQAFLKNAWTILTAISTVLTAILLPRQWFWVVPTGIAAVIVFAAFRAVGIVRHDCVEEIGHLRAEITSLRVRPCDEDHRKIVEDKLQKLTATGTKILHFLLHHGRFESNALRSKFEGQPSFDAQLTLLSGEHLLSRADEPIPGRSGINLFWYVNPEFTEVLKDLLY